MPTEIPLGKIHIRDLPEDDKLEIMSTLMSRIIEDILTFTMTEAMIKNEEEVDSTILVETFFSTYDLRVLTLGNLKSHLPSLGESARRIL